jgi:propanediol dehydratase small subunit
LLDKILNSISVDTPLQDVASQSNIKSPDQPLASTRNDMVKIKCGLAPNLDLTLGLTREKTVTDEGLESYSSPWSGRSYSIGLTFRF